MSDPITVEQARKLAAHNALVAALKECLAYVVSDYEIQPGGVFGGDAQGVVDRARAALALAKEEV